MKYLTLALMGAALLWIHVTITPTISLWGYHPNLFLVGLGIVAMRWMNPWVLLFAVAGGLVQDAFSHGIMGVYALSYLITAILAHQIGRYLYENSTLLSMAGILGITLIEGLTAIIILKFLETDVPGFRWFFTRSLPVAFYNALLTPVILFALHWWDNFFESEIGQ